MIANQTGLMPSFIRIAGPTIGTTTNTISMIVRQALMLTLLGVALGVVGALATTRFLRQLLFEIEPSDPMTYGTVVAAVVLIAMLAALSPARRAARIDPAVALRDE